jgi:hypothetical protein
LSASPNPDWSTELLKLGFEISETFRASTVALFGSGMGNTEEILGVPSHLIRSYARERDERLAFMTASLRQSKGQVSVAQVSEHLGITNRQLERLSNVHLGLPP